MKQLTEGSACAASPMLAQQLLVLCITKEAHAACVESIAGVPCFLDAPAAAVAAGLPGRLKGGKPGAPARVSLLVKSASAALHLLCCSSCCVCRQHAHVAHC